MNLRHQPGKHRPQFVRRRMPETEHERIDAFEDDRLLADGVLQVDGAAVAAVEPGIGRDADTLPVQFGGDVVAHVERQQLAGMGAVDGELDAAAVVDEQLGDAGADPVAAPVGDDDAAAGLDLPAQHLPGIDHLDAVVGGDFGHVGRGTGREHDGIGLFALDQGRIDANALDHAHLRQFQFTRKIGDDAAEFGAARQLLGEQRLAAELVRGFIERDLMAAGGGDRGRLHAARPAADHHDLLRCGRRHQRAEGQLAAGLRVLDAGDRHAAVKVADAGLVAGDAGADVVGAALLGLCRHLGIADQRARHAADIGRARGDDRLGLVRLVDAAGDEDRHLQRLAEAGGVAGKVGVAIGHGRHDMHRAAERGGGAGRDVDIVDQRFEQATALQRLIGRQAVLVAVPGTDAQADDEILRCRRTDRLQRFRGKTQPVLQRSAIAVRPPVDARVQELGRQVAVARHQFHAVDTGFMHAPGRRAVAGDDLVDHRLVERARHHAKPLVGRDGGRIGDRQQPVAAFHDLPARMEELREERTAMGMAGLRQPAVAVDAAVVRRHQHMRGVAGRLVHAGHLADDEADAALRPRRVIGDKGLVDAPVRRQRRVVAGRHDAVLQPHAADREGLEQVREGGGRAHAALPVLRQWRMVCTIPIIQSSHPERAKRGAYILFKVKNRRIFLLKAKYVAMRRILDNLVSRCAGAAREGRRRWWTRTFRGRMAAGPRPARIRCSASASAACASGAG
nr:hypothetical protein SHINE37_10579 [Rhizobiaceae bacterium]